MIAKIILFVFFGLTIALTAFAQNTNSSSTARPRSTNTNQTPTPTPKATDTTKPATVAPTPRVVQKKPAMAASEVPGSAAVIAAFNRLLDGIRHANVNMVASVYWKSPGLLLFNNNGSVTKGWEQMRKNRESSYPDLKNVKLDVRDVAVTMLGRDGAVVTCLWTQSQTYKGTPETAAGRMTLVFKRVGRDWNAIHLHTSPDAPNPASVPASEQTPAQKPSPTPNLREI